MVAALSGDAGSSPGQEDLACEIIWATQVGL